MANIDSSFLLGTSLKLDLDVVLVDFFFNALNVATEFRKLFFGFAEVRDGGGVFADEFGIGGGSSSGGAVGTALFVGRGPRNCPGNPPP